MSKVFEIPAEGAATEKQLDELPLVSWPSVREPHEEKPRLCEA